MLDNLYYYKAKVVRIVDGDTICADIDCGFSAVLQNQRLRLLGVNAPETKGVSKAAGLASKEFVKAKLLYQPEIIIRTVKSDDFGRYLAQVYYYSNMDRNWRCLNDDLVSAGHAEVFQ
jgi:micrococcal nuclease